MKRLTAGLARCILVSANDTSNISHFFEKHLIAALLRVCLCLALNRLTVYERMLGGFVLASKGG
jgi:hypothetical protein